MKSKTPLAALAQRLEMLRWERRLNQRSLAQKMGVSDAYVSAVLRGRKTLLPEGLSKFAEALRIPKSELQVLHQLGARAQGWDV